MLVAILVQMDADAAVVILVVAIVADLIVELGVVTLNRSACSRRTG